MTYTLSFDVSDLQNRTVQALKLFSEIQKVKVKDNNFIQKKVNQISKQRTEFRKFVDESIAHVLKISTYSDDLIVFAECCEDKSISDDELLELLRSLLSDSRKQKENAESLRNQLKTIMDALIKITGEIAEYNEEITKKRNDLPDKIDKTEKVKDNAKSVAKGGLLTVGAGALAAVVAAPFTGGASLVAEAVVGLGTLSIVGGAATSAASGVVAGASSIAGAILNCELNSARDQFSQFLQEMQKSIEAININISYCEYYWDEQTIEIEGIIEKLERNNQDEKRMARTVARTIASVAERIRKNAKNYGADMRQVLSKDSISQ